MKSNILKDHSKFNVKILYVIYYGQLKDCNLKVGDHVNRGQEFASVAQPTKYFTMEGSHLYLRLERNDEPVNPLSYLDFSE